MSESQAPPAITIFLLQSAALVIIIAGLKTAATVVVPFLLAVFVAFIAVPPLLWLQSRGLPYWLSLVIIILVGLMLDVVIVAFFGASISEFTSNYSNFNARLAEALARLQAWLANHGITVSEDFYHKALSAFDPSVVMRMTGNLLSSLSNVLGKAFLIFLITVFILLEVPSFPGKLALISRRAQSTLDKFHLFSQDLIRYLAIKSAVSLATGLLIALWLSLIGVDFSLLWGLLAFLFNFVPNIGSIIAAVPAVLLALVLGGLNTALLAVLGYLVVNVVMGNILEPKVMGQGLGLSVLAVFLSLIFWGWVLGPVGMLLSVPLTLFMKVVLESREDTRWLAILLGPGNPAETSETEKEAEKAG